MLAACAAMRALTTSPPHGHGTSIEAALRQVQAASGTVYDPTVVWALSQELLGDVPLVPGIEPADEWARGDVLYRLAEPSAGTKRFSRREPALEGRSTST